MAFGLQYLSRVEISPNLDKTLNVGQGQDSQRLPTMWMYNASSTGANDPEATVDATSYFDGAYGYLTVGDLIYAYTNDPGYHLYAVTTVSSSATAVSVLV